MTISTGFQTASTQMNVNGCTCTFNLTDALKGKEIHSLPGYGRTLAYPVGEYPACPKEWMHGSAKAGSYFLEASVGKGLWLDFNECAGHPHHMAIVMSIQGINPITGKPVTELNLQQYQDKCPIHDIPFEQDRFCPHKECRYKWPKQNYLATAVTPAGLWWIDGFRAAGDVVEQYIIDTVESARGVAQQIEKQDKDFERVWAIGVAFYLLKEAKTVYKPGEKTLDYALESYPLWTGPMPTKGGGKQFKGGGTQSKGHATLHHFSGPRNIIRTGGPISASSLPHTSDDTLFARESSVGLSNIGASDLSINEGSADEVVVESDEKSEIGAGAPIFQKIHNDTHPVDEYRPEPEAMIYINYASPTVYQRILAGGRRKEKSGPLADMKTGN